ncbi:hypothetical protein HMPREF1546_03327, partial [Oscillibacter sp. KLE 1745]
QGNTVRRGFFRKYPPAQILRRIKQKIGTNIRDLSALLVWLSAGGCGIV